MSLGDTGEIQVAGDTISVADLSQFIRLPDGVTGLPSDITILEQSNNIDEEGNTIQTFVFVTQQQIGDIGDGKEMPVIYQALELPQYSENHMEVPITLYQTSAGVTQTVPEAAMPDEAAVALPPAPPPPDIRPPVGKGPFPCESCDKVCQKWGQYQRHVKSHANDKPHPCPECKASFNILENLALHRAIHVAADNDPTCPDCGKKFSRIASLKAHLMMHEREETLMCPECGDEFGLMSQLNRHLKEHQAVVVATDRSYSCRQCNLEFNKLSLLREHAQQHKKIKTSLQHRSYKRNIDRSGFHNQCQHCGKTFQKPSQLKRHARIHTGERPFSCKECNKSFNQKGALQIHMAKHTGDKPHVCDFCQATFAQRGNLRAHIKRVHILEQSGELVYGCHECSCVFRKIGSLHAHISRVHTMQQDVPLEEADVVDELIRFTYDSGVMIGRTLDRATDNTEADKSQLVPTTEAEESGETASTVDSGLLRRVLHDSGIIPARNSLSVGSMSLRDTSGVIKKHIVRKVNGIRWHQCNWCSKEFKKPSDLVRHTRIHTLEKPYKCTQCFRSFTVKSTLTAHIKTHTGVKEFNCAECHKLFATQGSLKVHLRLHTGQRPFECPYCHKSFRTSTHLKTHADTHHKSDSSTTTTRSHKLGRRMEKVIAANTNLPDITLQEPILITDSGLVQQQTKALGDAVSEEISLDRPYRCGFCHRGFKKSSHLKQHVRSHTGERPYKCIRCLRSFVSNAVLKAHIRTHTGVKAYKCLICDLMFTTNGSLKRHMTTHSEVRPFMCPYCQKTFKTSVNCKKHMKTHKQELALQVLHQQQTGSEEQTHGGHDDVQTTEIITIAQPGGDGTQFGDVTAEMVSMNSGDLAQEQVILSGDSVVYNNLDMQTFNQQIQQTLSQQIQQTFTQQIQQTLDQQALSQIPHYTQSLLTNQTLNQLGLSQGTFTIPTTLDLNSLGGAVITEQQLNGQLTTDDDGVTTVVQQSSNEENVSESELVDDFSPNKESNDASRTYPCYMCPKAFKKSSHLKQHIRSHTGEKPFKCAQCGRGFVSSGVLKSHVRTHAGSKNHRCRVCHATFTTNGSLTRHMVIHRDVGPLRCTYGGGCGEVCHTQAALRQHIQIHKDDEDQLTTQKDRPVFEEVKDDMMEQLSHAEMLSVSEKVLLESSFEKHKTISDKRAPQSHRHRSAHQCSQCPKSFKKPSDLLRHVRTHTGEKPFVCIICARQFTVKSTLDSHMKTHNTAERNYQCHICQSLFSTRGSLKVHMRLHTGAKPFTCPHCDLRFRTSGHRKSHLLSHFKTDVSSRRRKSNASKHAPEVNAVSQQPGQIVVQPVTNEDLQQGLLNLGGEMVRVQSGVQIPMSLTADMMPSETQQVLSSLDGLQLHFTSQLGGQTIQLTTAGGLEAGGVMQQPMHIDAALLQQLQQHGNLNITIDSNVVQSGGGGSSVLQIQPISIMDGHSNVIVQPLNAIPLDSQINQHMVSQQMVSQQMVSQQMVSQQMVSQQMVSQQMVQPQIIAVPTVDLHQQVMQQQVIAIPTSLDNLTHIQELDGSYSAEFEQVQSTIHQPQESDPDQQVTELDDGEIEPLEMDRGVDGETQDEGELLDQSVHGMVDEDVHRITEGVHVISTGLVMSQDPENVCYICYRAFTNADKLKDHMSVHVAAKMADIEDDMADEKGDDDENDDESGVQLSELTKTSAERARGPTHKCAVCHKLFNKPSQLERHVRIHTGERPFQCTVCEKAFNQKNALQTHMKKHSGERPFVCPYCHASFSQKGNLNVHVKRAHHSDMVKSMRLGTKHSVTDDVKSLQDTMDDDSGRLSPNIGRACSGLEQESSARVTPFIGTAESIGGHMISGGINQQSGIGNTGNILASQELDLEMQDLFGNT